MEEILQQSFDKGQELGVGESEEIDEFQREKIKEAEKKVMKWFERNEVVQTEHFDEFNDILSIKSESEINTISDISVPSAVSADSNGDYSSKSENDDCKQNKPPLKPITLSSKKFYDVEILNFDDIDSFFVVVKRESERRWNRLIRRLNKYRDRLEPLKKISRGLLCLIKTEDAVHRAVIQNNNKVYAICFGLDNGKLYVLDTTKTTLYKMSYKIKNTVEYQAINCKLSDVRMPKSPELAKFVYDKVISKIKKPQIKVVKSKYSRFVDDRCMAMNKYKVMLIDEETGFIANEEIARSIQGRSEFNYEYF